MIYILHGENSVLSRNLINGQFKKSGCEKKTELDVADFAVVEIQMKLSSFDMFGETALYVLNLSAISKEKCAEIFDVVRSIDSKTPNMQIVLFSPKPLPISHPIISGAKEYGLKVTESKLGEGSNIFKLIDDLLERRRKSALREFSNLMCENEKDYTFPSYLMSMLGYTLRNVVFAFFKTQQFEKLKDFQKSKYQKYCRDLDMYELLGLYDDILNYNEMHLKGEIDADMMLSLSIEKILAHEKA